MIFEKEEASADVFGNEPSVEVPTVEESQEYNSNSNENQNVEENPPAESEEDFVGDQSGRTTRYWDCCKPSCSWNGKSSGQSSSGHLLEKWR